MDRLIAGTASVEDFDDVLDEWNTVYADAPEGQYPQFHEYMGLTWDEYTFVATDERRLNTVVAAHRAGVTLAEHRSALGE